MELTIKQNEGLNIALERYKNNEKYTVIAGYAGTGKSTLIKVLIEALEIDPIDVAYITFTGKAAEVLRVKGNPNATTAHKLLYKAVRKEDGTFMFLPKELEEINYKVIVVDEVSMLPKTMWDRLLKTSAYIIACGDPFQIPPVDKDNDNHVLDNPHIFLDEVMRQAQDSEIIRLSMDIREGRPIEYHRGTEVDISPKIIHGMYEWADQIIVGTNNMRRNINNTMRQSLGRGEMPCEGDKVISLANHWNISDTTGDNALVNGTIGYLGKIYNNNQFYSVPYSTIPKTGVPVTFGSLKTENGYDFEKLVIDRQALTSTDGKKFLDWKQENAIMKSRYCQAKKQYPPLEFNYGYAITCHKAQGSAWNKVLIIEERFPFDKIEHARWLYTAVTRAVDKCVLVR